jgi:saccharopine dehydrogenase (NAD+, L-glutamate forming)
VVLAGQGGAARYIYKGEYKYLPYQRLFQDITDIEIEGHGRFEGYANRDSLGYRSAYGLGTADTVYRGTLRKHGYSAAWNVFVQLGMTDDSYRLEHAASLSAADFLSAFLPGSHSDGTLRERLLNQTQFFVNQEIEDKIEWLGLFRSDWYPVSESVSPAQYLQTILEQRWILSPGDRDMIVMWHRFLYTLNGRRYEKHAWLVTEGENELRTAMASTVGLPLGISVKLILTGKISRKGVLLPVTDDIYTPVLAELETFGIRFTERDFEIYE